MGITERELREAIESHGRWLVDRSSGRRLDFSEFELAGADLAGAELAGANLPEANLTGADLTEADFTDANLTKANLTGADLTGANLIRANLTRADLTCADLTCDDLTEANLTDADLTGADLTDSNLIRAYLTGANLTRAYLTDANLTGANLTRADLTGALFSYDIPTVNSIDRVILNKIKSGGRLYMGDWHKCDSTHCRAGWAVIVLGERGTKLESKIGTNAAASLIYARSRPGVRVPDWFESNEESLRDIKKYAKIDA